MIVKIKNSTLPSCLVIDDCEAGVMVAMKKAQEHDQEIRKIREAVEKGESADCVVRGGLVFEEDNSKVKLIVPKKCKLRLLDVRMSKDIFRL